MSLNPCFIRPNDLVSQRLFLLLTFDDLLFNRPHGDKAINSDISLFAQFGRHILRLFVVGGIPVVIVKDDRMAPVRLSPSHRLLC